MFHIISQFFRGSIGIFDVLLAVVTYALIVLVALPFHEFAHGFIADKLGDHTARYSGRLTMNPLRHLDIFGTAMLVLFGIGYAKPVPVNPANFRKPRRDMALTALAGPVSNLLLAVLAIGVYRLCTLFTVSYTSLVLLRWLLVYTFAGINISLAVFNILPIPPLDGYRLLTPVLPSKWLYYVDRYQQYITLVVILLLFTGALDRPIYFLQQLFGNLIGLLFGMPQLF